MKKKFKLLTSIASLGLALALGVFGVLAATGKTFNVSTSVSFTATQHVKVTVNGYETTKLAATPGDSDWGTAKSTQNLSVDAAGADTGSLTDIVFTGATLDASNTYYGYKVTIKNDDTENALPMKLTYADKTAAQYTIDFTVSGVASEEEIAVGETATIIMVIHVTDLAGNRVDITNADMNLQVKLGTDATA